MKKLITVLVIIIVSLFIARAAWSLPNCVGAWVYFWNDCYGTYVFSGEWKGDKYVGEFKDGKMHGQGTYTFSDGYLYVGGWQSGNKYGQGTLTYPDGRRYVGGWDDEPYGQGTFFIPNGIEISGEWHGTESYGLMTVTYPSDGRKAIGEIKDNYYFPGTVYVTYPDGSVYIGEWGGKNGVKQGQGEMTYADGTTKEGVWNDDEFLYWKCKSDYIKSGQRCLLKSDIPANAYASSSHSQGWECNTGYYQNNDFCSKLPSNASAYSSEDGFFCNSGYQKSGNSCIKKINIPANAHSSGDSWICNTDYYRNSSLTGCLRVPANASSSYDSNYWKCKSSYERVGAGCEKELSEIYIDGDKYVGELRNGKPHGKGTMTYTDDEYKYVGEWQNGEKHGKGTVTLIDGTSWVSEWRNDEPYGQITLTFTNGVIAVSDAKDEWKFATITFPSGNKYTGELNDDFDMHGQGTYTFLDGAIYVGQFKNEKFHGQGTYTFSGGDIYVGQFKNNNFHGQGKITYADGTTQEGVWEDDEFLYAKNESTPKNNYSNDEELLPAASGTGFAVTSDGYIVTNNHVVKDCNNVEIYHKGRAIPSVVVNVDPIMDLAIIKGNFRPEKFYYLSTKRPRLRMSVDVIGYGFGKKISSNVKVTRGIISSLVGIENDSSRIQIDAAVQPGNSGGPIIDEIGNVVGVAVEKVNVDWAEENLSRLPENIAFGIKSGAVINFLDGNNIEYSIDNELSDNEIDTLIHSGTYYLSCLMTLSQYEKVIKTRVLFSDLE